MNDNAFYNIEQVTIKLLNTQLVIKDYRNDLKVF